MIFHDFPTESLYERVFSSQPRLMNYHRRLPTLMQHTTGIFPKPHEAELSNALQALPARKAQLVVTTRGAEIEKTERNPRSISAKM